MYHLIINQWCCSSYVTEDTAKTKNNKTVPSNILTLFDIDLDSLFLQKK